MAYQANGVTFDGTNDYLQASTTPGTDSDKLLFSGWLRRNSTGTGQTILCESGIRYYFRFQGSDVLRISAVNSSGTTVVDIESSAITDTVNWIHIATAIDLSVPVAHLYVNGVSDLATTTTLTSSATMDFTTNYSSVGSVIGGDLKFDGDMADIWFGPGQFLDLSVAANLRKFYGPNGGAVDLGADGSTPTGVQPAQYFTGATATWHNNVGSQGSFGENGALTDAATDPPTEPDTSSLVLERGLGRGIQRGIMRGV